MNMPVCPNSRPDATGKYKRCTSPRVVILQEGETHWQFGCDSCKCAWVVSKPETKDAKQWEAAQKRAGIRQFQQAEYERRRKFFDLRRSA